MINACAQLCVFFFFLNGIFNVSSDICYWQIPFSLCLMVGILNTGCPPCCLGPVVPMFSTGGNWTNLTPVGRC